MFLQTGEFSARFLLKLPVDFSNIPVYLLKVVCVLFKMMTKLKHRISLSCFCVSPHSLFSSLLFFLISEISALLPCIFHLLMSDDNMKETAAKITITSVCPPSPFLSPPRTPPLFLSVSLFPSRAALLLKIDFFSFSECFRQERQTCLEAILLTGFYFLLFFSLSKHVCCHMGSMQMLSKRWAEYTLTPLAV